MRRLRKGNCQRGAKQVSLVSTSRSSNLALSVAVVIAAAAVGDGFPIVTHRLVLAARWNTHTHTHTKQEWKDDTKRKV